MTRQAARFVALAILICAAQAARAQLTLPTETKPVDGATLFKRQCAACHSLQSGDPPRQGPNLAGVYGRHAGTAPGFHYSPGFAQADFTWDEDHLDRYLANPQAVIPGAVMPYRQADPKIRHSIIAYLKEQH